MPIIPIASKEDPRIANYLGVRDAELRRERFDAPGGLFIAEGELVFRRLLASPYATQSVLLTPSRLRTVQDAVDQLPPDVPIYMVDQALMNDIVGFNIHRGVLALGIRGTEPDLPTALARASCAVVLEDLANHDNIGAIFRNVAALAGLPSRPTGGGLVLLSPRCSDPLYRKAIRVSMGWVLGVPFARLDPWPASLAALRSAGYTILALHPHPDARDISAVAAHLAASDSPRKIAIVVGTEGAGLSKMALEAADQYVRIPMRGQTSHVRPENGPSADENGDNSGDEGVDSLNVGVAVAIALHRLTDAGPT